MHPTCFVSYSWDSEAHKEWVRVLAVRLQSAGAHTHLDQWDVRPGADLTKYMETSVRESDFVLLICTATFANKANSGLGGVGYEKSIVTGEIFTRVAADTKFVPLLRAGDQQSALPSYLRNKAFIDFRKDTEFEGSLITLLRHVHASPAIERPILGSRPDFSILAATSQNNVTLPAQPSDQSTLDPVDEACILCERCGVSPGSYSSCIGATAHSFKTFNTLLSKIYCTKCGRIPNNSYSSCIGTNAHQFKLFAKPTEEVYCKRCGQRPGAYSSCIGATAHDFE